MVPQPSANGGPACNAPFSSLHLDPKGIVRACCQNTWHHLGSIEERSLIDIWHGPEVAELRERLAVDDLSLGCELCDVERDLGAGNRAHLHQFADLPPRSNPPTWPRQLELALSNSCNLQCAMCNGELSSAIRIHRERRAPLPAVYDDRFFEELERFFPHLERVTFLGGEPFLGAEPLRVMEQLITGGYTPTCHINTNGTRWNPTVERIIANLPLHLTVSIDGWEAATLERIRIGVDHTQLHKNIKEMRQACQRAGSSFGIAVCLMTENWREVPALLRWADVMDCDAFVNTVTNPPRFSLHHASAREIQEISDGLAGFDAELRANLGRNRRTWDHVLEQVRLLETARAADHLTRPDPEASARRAIADLVGDGPITWMRADEGLRILALDPGASQVLGTELDHLVGGSTIGLVETVGPTLGKLSATSLRMGEGGVEVRSFEFSSRGSTQTLAAAMARVPDGEVWYLALVDQLPSDGLATPVVLRRRAHGSDRTGSSGAGAH
jgi:MoaA/NifB/PqqE/SkfB family radical SAM enzyme